MVGLGATLEIAGPDGPACCRRRTTQGAYTTGLREDELIAAVHVPEAGPAARWGYYKFCRKTGEFAEASCAAWFDAASKTARIAVGALDGAPGLLPGWPRALRGRTGGPGPACSPTSWPASCRARMNTTANCTGPR